jgi:hypothetical protein
MNLWAHRAGVLLASVLAASPLAACTRGGEAPRPADPKLSAFEEVVSRQNRLPAEFPRSLPLPKEHRVLYSAVSNLGVSAYFETGDPADTVKGFMLRQLPDAGWVLRSCQVIPRSPEPVTIITADKDGSAATVTVGYHPDYAQRLAGGRYDLLVSVAFRSPSPEAVAPGRC